MKLNLRWHYVFRVAISVFIAAVVLAGSLLQWADLTTYTALQEWQSAQSEGNWAKWDTALRAWLKQTVDSLNNIDIDALIAEDLQRFPTMKLNVERSKQVYQTTIEQMNAQYNMILGKLDSVRDQRIYRRYLHAFMLLHRYKVQGDEPRTLNDDYFSAFINLDRLSDFLDNIEYSLKIEQEFGVTMTHTSHKFIWANIREMYDDMHKLPAFVIRNSGLKQISLREVMKGSAAQMDESEMAGRFSEHYPDSSIVVHELTHALDLNQGLGYHDAGWRALNTGVEPYRFEFGSQAIEAAEKDPTAPDLNLPLIGYARLYGQQGGILEDKDTISEYILTVHSIHKLVGRAVSDPVLKKKIEFMSGYHLDVPFSAETDRKLTEQEEKEYKQYAPLARKMWGKPFYPNPLQAEALKRLVTDDDFRKGVEYAHNRKVRVVFGFGTPLTDQEYIDAGFAGRSYWSLWSKDADGRVWLDAEFYNALLQEAVVKFSEEDGHTKRLITREKMYV